MLLLIDRTVENIIMCVYITASLWTLNVVLMLWNKFGEHNAPAHNAISGVVNEFPSPTSWFDASIRSMYMVGVPYRNVHLVIKKKKLLATNIPSLGTRAKNRATETNGFRSTYDR